MVSWTDRTLTESPDYWEVPRWVEEMGERCANNKHRQGGTYVGQKRPPVGQHRAVNRQVVSNSQFLGIVLHVRSSIIW